MDHRHFMGEEEEGIHQCREEVMDRQEEDSMEEECEAGQWAMAHLAEGVMDPQEVVCEVLRRFMTHKEVTMADLHLTDHH